ncbi:two-component regulator propeller domain-containing protein [Rhodonellum sp.]|uniref:two-component regulator propeller domain-containing protein n=1 Tax=Rhodonellum sp. TaxID=2231180 RepID=UPI0027191D05|nr:two-component regulator propeller domain-containing protein [Rhodonellum sp.]MDO9553402.1 triple tyrosine motif-containing protein [Rhodonellum sp.]
MIPPKMLYRFILLLSFLSLNECLGQTPGLPFSKYYSSKDYNGGTQNFAITQSSSGLIYVANNFGLLEYDGAGWRRYPLPNSTKVRDVLLDERGIIYTSGQGEFGYFQADQTGILRFHSLLDQLPEANRNLEEIWKIQLLHDRVYFFTLENVFVFSKDHQLLNIISGNPAFESFHSTNNQLFLNQLDSGLQLIEKNKLEPLDFGKSLGNNLIVGIISFASNQKLFFTRDQGIFRLNSVGMLPWQTELSNKTRINKAIRLKNGNIAIGTQSDGIFILNENGEIILKMNNNPGLQNKAVLSLFEDISGNLWVGHNNGISLIELSLPFREIDQYSGLSGSGYDADFFDGKLYYGTNNGLAVQQMNGNTASQIQKIEHSSGQVYSISEIHNKLFLGHNDGAYEIIDGQAKSIDGVTGIWKLQPLRDHHNMVIGGSYNGLVLFEFKDDKLKFVRKIKGFNESSRLIEQDNDGHIWMTHGYKGVYKLKLNATLDAVEVSYYGTEAGLPTNLLISVYKINNRLIFTTEYGMYSFDPQTDRFEKDPFFSQYFPQDFLLTSIIEDPLGNVFYIGEGEVGVLEKQINGTYLKKHQIFNKIIPLLNDDLQNISPIKANEILFAAKEGFIWYRLDNNNQNTPTFPTMIRSVYLTGATDSLISHGSYPKKGTGSSEELEKENISIPYSARNIRFEFSNPIPNNENTTQFQFWLEGLEKDFGEWTTKRDRGYTNLREGAYTFHVKSKNIYGQIGEEDRYSFSIQAPWYRSILAYLTYVLLVGGLLVLFQKRMDKKFQKKTAKITSIQREVIEQKETALKDSHEEIERLKNEQLHAEIKSKNKELASATMHLINKNGFIDHVKDHVATVVKKSKNQEVKNELQKVIQSIDKNMAGDNDWEQFEIHFDQVHGDFVNRFKNQFEDLSPQEIKLSAYLRMNLSSKEIAHLMNISTRGIEIARYRLRKKLNLNRAENLQEFILKF